MGLFSNEEPIIMKESGNARRQLAALESLRGTLPPAAEKQLEADIRAVRAGIAGEDRILYELRNSHMDMIVLQDLFLEHEGLTAQIDFLVLTRQRRFVLECKNLYGNIEVNEQGNFIRSFGGRKREGIYSPVTQNRRHIDLIRAMKRDDRSALMNLVLDREFDDMYRSLVVLANPKSVLDDRKAPADVKGVLVRADQLVARMRAINSQRGPNKDKVFMSAVQKGAEWFLEHDKGGGGVDFAAKYKQLASTAAVSAPFLATQQPGDARAAQAGSEAPATAGGRESQPDLNQSYAPGAILCPRCGAPMVLRTAKRGAHAGRQFYGCSNYPKCRGIVNVEA